MKSLHEVIFIRDPSFYRCPSCNEAYKLRRSHSRNLKEKFLNKLSFFKTYRCKECGWRGFQSTVTFTRKSLINILYYLFLAVAFAFIVFLILMRKFR